MSSDAPSKFELRSKIRSELGSLPQDSIDEASQKTCQHIASSEDFTGKALTIAVYAANGPEISLIDLHQTLPQSRLVYPLCHDGGRLSFHHTSNPTELTPGMLGILEPDPKTHKEVTISEIDLFLCPGLAFGLDGSRLGHGGGYYDRALAQFNGSIYGIAISLQLTDSVPHEDHDISMHSLITEKGIQATKPR
jgi:5-formyltetrahydrofolate cyclo-ligase|tara:strand:- start:919 stop:1497 length:579 start_codon:yes stop_codon:yes gene_type:complete